MKFLLILVAIIIFGSDRYVENNTIISNDTPKIMIQVVPELTYIGQFDFTIKAISDEYPENMRGQVIAAGERFVFARYSEAKKIEAQFIVQFEGFLPANDLIYRYRFDEAMTMGNNRYRNNSWFYSEKQLAKENPENESALTRKFLEAKGLIPADHVMMTRFVGLADSTRKNEIIIFYIENLDHSGYSLKELTGENSDTLKINKAGSELFDRAMKSFKIIDG